MKTILTFVLALTLVASQSAGAQRAERLGFTPRIAPHALVTTAAALPGNSGMPRWVRWGLVGAIGGGLLFVMADGFNGSGGSKGSAFLSGAATGFIVLGGGVLLYDSVCSGSGSSAFCGR